MKLRKKFSFMVFKKPRVDLPNLKKPKARFLNWKWILILLIVLSLIAGGLYAYNNINRSAPDEAVLTAIDNTLNAEAYRYKATSEKAVDDKLELLSEVNGEKSKNNVHFFGKLHVVNSEFEIYQIENKFYRKDVFSKDWLIVEDTNVKATEKLIQEINPLGAFCFMGPIDAEYIGKEKIDGNKCRKYEVLAQSENKYLEVLWKDFSYTVWIDRKGNLARAQVNAVNKQHENHRLIMNVDFYDLNKDIKIDAPI